MVAAPSFHNPTCAYNHPYNLHQKFLPLFQTIFTSLFHPYLFKKSSLQSPLTLPSTKPQQFSSSLFFAFSHPKNLHQKTFSLPHPFIQFRLCQRTRRLGSLVRLETVLISPFFLKVGR